MLAAGLAIGGLGLLAGVGLAVASKVFYVYVDPQIIEVAAADFPAAALRPRPL
jgi:Na+-translocating ferredoxin:NAD+ oxidoreductase RNF subunit RnfB